MTAITETNLAVIEAEIASRGLWLMYLKALYAQATIEQRAAAASVMADIVAGATRAAQARSGEAQGG